MQSACAEAYCNLWPAWFYHIFPHNPIYDRTSGEKNTFNIKRVLWFSLHLLSKKFLILRKLQRDTVVNGAWGSVVVKALVGLVGRSRDRFPVVSLDFFRGTPIEPRALRSTQPLKVSTRDFSWVKGGWFLWLTNCHPWSAETSRYSGVLTYPEPLGPPRPVAGQLYILLS